MHPDDKKTGTPDEESIFLAAIDIEDSQRRKAYLNEACQADPVLLKRVEALIKAHEESGAYLKIAGLTNSAGNTRDDTDAEPHASSAPAGEITSIDSISSQERLDLSILTPSTKPGSLGRLQHYEIEEVLGSGGCGTVFRAFDEKLHRRVALKLMAPELAVTSPARKRFLREARAAAAIRHDNVVQIYAVEEQPLPFIVMEYIAGKTLQQMHEEKGPFSIDEVAAVGQQIASGLGAAHATGLIHRDIKPGNILVEDGTHRVKITDFGLARTADDASITQSGVIAGTPLYMSPEQARGEPLDYRSDLFSLGSVLYVLCTGRPPFRAANTMAVLKRVVEDTPREMHDIVPEIPVWLIDIVEKLHAKDREARFQSAIEVAARLNLRDKAPQPAESELPQGDAKPLSSQSEKQPSQQEPATTVFLAGSHSFSTSFSNWATRPLGMAALVLLALLVGLGMTEGAGVTSVTKTIIRLFTPTGTLVVEVDDPNISLRIDGQEIVVTGAGVKELRLQPGQYEVEAKEGEALILKQLVNISSHGREVLKISQEATRKPTQATTPIGQSPPANGLFKDRTATIRKGHWTVEGDEVVQSATIESHVSFGNPEWTDIDFSYETMTTSNAADSQGGIGLFRVLDFNNLLSFPLGVYGGRAIELNRVIKGKWSRDNDGGYLNFTFEKQRWYQVKLQLRGDKTTCFLDGTQVLTMTDPHRLQGKVGFASWNSAVRFRNIRVTDPQGNLLWEGAPDLPQASPAAPIPPTSKTEAPAPVLTLQHTDPVRWVAFNKDGSRIVSASNGDDHEIRGGIRYHVAGKDNTVRVWDSRTGNELCRLRMTEGSHYGPQGIAISPDGTTLAASSGWATANGPSEPRVYVWNLETGERLHHFPLADNHCVRCVAFSPRGSVVKLTRSGKGGINSWTLPGGNELPRVVFQETPPGVEAPRMSFSPDANYLLSAVWNGPGDWLAWNTENGEIVKTFKGHTSPPSHVVLSPDARLALSCAPDFTIRLWDWQTGKQILCIGDDEILDDRPVCVAFSPETFCLAVGFSSGEIILYEIGNVRELTRMKGHTGLVHDLTFSADGQRLATAGEDRIVKVWNLPMELYRAAQIDADRRAAEYVLSKKCRIWINDEQESRTSLDGVSTKEPFRLTGVEFFPISAIDPQEFAVFRPCKHIKKLHFRSAIITDEHLQVFDQMESLREIILISTRVTRKSLISFRPNQSLKKLELWGIALQAGDLKHFADSPFESLDLAHTGLPAGEIRTFTNLNQLNNLRLSGTGVDVADLEFLKSLPNLYALAIDRTKLGDEAIAPISQMPALASLVIYNTQITDQSLLKMAGMPKLKYVLISGTKATAEGVARYRQERPDCAVLWNDGSKSGMAPTLKIPEVTKQPQDDREAIRYVLQNGGGVWIEGRNSSVWVLEELDFTKPIELTGIHLVERHQLKAKDFSVFQQSLSMRRADFQFSEIDDEHLEHLKDLPQLAKLNITQCSQVTGSKVRQFKHLTDLAAWLVPLQDGDLEVIGKNRVQVMNLGGTEITGKALGFLKDLSELRELNLAYTKIQTADLERFKEALPLESLNLAATKITNRAVIPFKALPNLQKVDLSETLVDDDVLAILVEMPMLFEVNLTKTKVTRDAVQKFREQKPLCEVTFEGEVLPRFAKDGDQQVKRIRADRSAARLVLRLGGSVTLNVANDRLQGPHATIPAGIFQLQGISLERVKNLRAEDFKVFANCRNLQSLDLSDCGLNDDCLKPFDGIETITELKLNTNQFSEAGFEYFRNCKQLSRLSAWAVPVTDQFVKSVANPHFTMLNLGATRITDASLEAFGGFSKLTWATLNLTGLTDKGVACLKDAKQLTYLGLNASKITNQSAQVFATLESLEGLYLNETRFSDAGLDQLNKALPKLRILELKKTPVTKDGVQRFQKNHPNCRIIWDGGEVPPAG
ncbi:protein kinase domain-containing protein [Planctopirus hydrillae]|uniref:Leucine-rich repeat and WD repeat-containing protein 1 n=1 Tax=Planctopirus hydrillae TaxID=1841610 RepID=A0A1C3E9R1_9PLAN|nr:protein kinase [Planctopirus hydrillae]ODA29971.1 hypothetical protein A6X21_06415 [Planctopirus hydrillae]